MMHNKGKLWFSFISLALRFPCKNALGLKSFPLKDTLSLFYYFIIEQTKNIVKHHETNGYFYIFCHYAFPTKMSSA